MPHRRDYFIVFLVMSFFGGKNIPGKFILRILKKRHNDPIFLRLSTFNSGEIVYPLNVSLFQSLP